MNCTTCGAIAGHGQTYCQRCGGSLVQHGMTTESSGQIARWSTPWPWERMFGIAVIFLIAGMTLGIVPIILGFVMTLLRMRVPLWLVLTLASLAFSTFVTIIALLRGPLLSLASFRREQSLRPTQMNSQPMTALPQSQMSSVVESIGSVTEKTTRSLDRLGREF